MTTSSRLEVGVNKPIKQHTTALTLLVGRQEDLPACKTLSDEVLVSEARCKWFAYGSADATATPSSLASSKYRI